MKKEIKVETTITLDHEKKNSGEACGIDEKNIRKFISSYMKEFVIKKMSLSETVEFIAKNLPGDYLAYILLNEIVTRVQELKNHFESIQNNYGEENEKK